MTWLVDETGYIYQGDEYVDLPSGSIITETLDAHSHKIIKGEWVLEEDSRQPFCRVDDRLVWLSEATREARDDRTWCKQ